MHVTASSYVYLVIAAGASLGWLFTRFLCKPLLSMIVTAGFVRPNYRSQEIPVSAGIVIVLSVIATLGVLIGTKAVAAGRAYPLVFLVVGFGLLGILDDFLGSRENSGLKGHLSVLIKEHRLTTGALKAIFGGLLSLLVSWYIGGSFVDVMVRALVIALSANFINLLDLRPGRAIKGFFFAVLVSLTMVVIMSSLDLHWALILTLAGTLLAYAPYDLRAQAMMGDAGSNPVGAGVGYAIAITSSTVGSWYLWVWFVFLIGLHVYAEKRSITKTIEQSRILKALDDLGRGNS